MPPADRYKPKKLAVESLEPRRVLAVVTVTNNTDDVNGDASSVAALIADPGDDGVSLREAIEATNATPGADEIHVNSPGYSRRILLRNGELRITDDLLVAGPGWDDLMIGSFNSRTFLELVSKPG